MPETKSNTPPKNIPEKVWALLVLPNPPKDCSADDWYWKKICGVPFLLRNVFNLQRAGISSLLIYSNKVSADLYKKLCDEKKISMELRWTTDVTEVTKTTNNRHPLVLSGGALHTKEEIKSGINQDKEYSNDFVQYIQHKTIADTVGQISCGNIFLSSQSSTKKDFHISFLPGKKNSCINAPQDFLIQQKTLLQSSGLSNDSFMDKAITRFFSRQLTRLFINTPLSPNMITALSLCIGLVSAVFFLQGTHKDSLIGAGTLLFSAWIDCTDGEVARLKFLESKIGGKLDIICDNLVHITVFFAIGMGLYQSTGKDIFKLLAFLAVFGSLISFLVLSPSIINLKEKVSIKKSAFKVKNNLTNNLANRDFIYFLLLMAIIGRVDIFIYVTAFGSNIFAAYLIYSKIKSALSTS